MSLDSDIINIIPIPIVSALQSPVHKYINTQHKFVKQYYSYIDKARQMCKNKNTNIHKFYCTVLSCKQKYRGGDGGPPLVALQIGRLCILKRTLVIGGVFGRILNK